MAPDIQVAAKSSCGQISSFTAGPQTITGGPKEQVYPIPRGKKMTELKIFPLIFLIGLGLKSEPQIELEDSMSSKLRLSMDGVREAIHT